MRWILSPDPTPETIRVLTKALGVSDTVAKLLAQRDIHTFEEAKTFFRPNLEQLHDPFLMADMRAAVDRIAQAIEQQEPIMIFGDYDVDGTTSVAMLYDYLSGLHPLITTYIPDRYNEGYGISMEGIDFADDNGITLIIALDCGIKAVDLIEAAKSRGIDFIICDHHRPGPRLPDAVAVLDPKRSDCAYPYKELCGCGVGFKLIQAMELHRNGTDHESFEYLDLVVTAIAADIVPITGENRVLAYYGLQRINAEPRPGLYALLRHKEKREYTISDLVFTVAPRINAAGRMEHGSYAVQLLTEKDTERAIELGKAIDNYNTERKSVDAEITNQALQHIRDEQEEDRMTTVVYNPAWHKGVVGIVASRLIEHYYRPTVVFTRSKGVLAGSVRSIKGFDVYEALHECANHIIQFGGHAYAAGLTVAEECYPAFKEAFEQVVSERLGHREQTPEVIIDSAIELNEIDNRFYRILRQFAPFGPGNRKPTFMTTDVWDTGFARNVGADQTHLKLRITNGSKSFAAIGFNLGDKLGIVQNKKHFKAVFSLDENHWNGNVELQFLIRDIKP